MYIKLKRLFLGRALKCLSWPDSIPRLSPDVSRRQQSFVLAQEPQSLRNWGGTCVAHLMQAWQGMDPPQVKLDKVRPDDPKARVLLCFVQKKWVCDPEGAAAEVLGCNVRQWWNLLKLPEVPICVGGTGTTVHLDQSHIHPQLPCWMVWFVGMVTRHNKAWVFFIHLLGLGWPVPRSPPGHRDKHLV